MHFRHRNADTFVSPVEDAESGKAGILPVQKKRKKRRRKLKRRSRWPLFCGIFLMATLAPVAVYHILRYFVIPQAPNIAVDGELRSRNVLPEDNLHVSVVVMNHNRPRMVRESNLIRTFADHPNINEILLCHSNPTSKFEYQHEKVRNIDAVEANNKMGLALRFHYCHTSAENEWVIHVDDDQELSKQAIDALLVEFSRNTKRIVGKFGRAYHWWRAPQRHGYDTKIVLGPVEVVLTKLLIVEKAICESFFRYEHLVKDMLPDSKPKWNGEDIFLSLTANHVYGVPGNGPFRNFAMDLDVWEASDEYKDDDTGEHDISGNMDRHRISNVGFWNWIRAFCKAQSHAAYRGKLWFTAKQRLAALHDVEL